MRALLLLALALPTAFVAADPNQDPSCGSHGLGVIQIGVDERATFYLDDRNFLLGNGLWIYQESNGVFTPTPVAPEAPPSLPPEGFPARWWEWVLPIVPTIGGDPLNNLQRGGSSILVPDDTEICTDQNPAGPDTLIF